MATTPRILVVDDFSEIAKLLGYLLNSVGGFDTRTATDAFEGIRIAEEFRPQFVFLDIGMPGLNGFQMAKRIRKEPWGKRMQLIAMSARWDEDDDRQGQEAGFDGYVLKPAPVKAMVDLVEKFSHPDCVASSRTRLRRLLIDPHLNCVS
jgi:DNA-binding response OmpR family regulator